MPISLNTNVASLLAQRRLSDSTRSTSDTFTRLSSGLRINRASDDAAGLSIASALNSDARVYTQGIKNLNDGIGLLSVAEGGLQQLNNISIRVKELSEQAANGTFSTAQRRALDQEADALIDEYNRIIQTTKFNGLTLLDGSVENLTLQAGYGTLGSLQIGIGSELNGTVSSGTFGAQASYALSGATPVGIAYADFNEDGVGDLLLPTNGNVQVQLGNSDGTFKLATGYNTGAGLTSATSGDLNNDGNLDIVMTDWASDRMITMLGNGDGTFKAKLSYSTGDYPVGVVVFDFNQDGNADIATLDQNTAGTPISIHLSNADGTFLARTSLNVPGTAGPGTFLFTDFNLDGFRDFLISNPSSGGVSVILANANGSFKVGSQYGGITLTTDLAVGDLNGDGILDIATANSNTATIGILLGNANGSLLAPSFIVTAGPSPYRIEIGDLNSDGAADLVVADQNDNSIVRFQGNGNGTFLARTTLAQFAARPNGILLTDLNEDGIDDLSVPLNGTSVAVLFGNSAPGNLLAKFDLTTVTGALEALDQTTVLVDNLIRELGTIGSHMSRVGIGIQNLQQSSQNYLDSASRILDADVAVESAQLTRSQIAQQAAVAVLAQANNQPSLALSLLRG